MKTAAIIGSGFGGLALGIRLQSAGIATTIIEARDRPGGRAYQWQRSGFTFDAGPTVITDPDCLAQLWRLSGRDMAEDVTLSPVSPFYRLSWPDGTVFDYSNDDAALNRQIAALNPTDVAGYSRFLGFSTSVYQAGYRELGHVAFLNFSSMIKAAPALVRNQAWRSVYAMVSSFVANDHLREALSFHSLLVGGNPMTTSAIYALIHALEKEGGVWFPKGGTHALIRAMVRQFGRLGGVIRLDDPVVRIMTRGDRVMGLKCRSGWEGQFDAIASNGDVVHTYQDLLSHRARKRQATKALYKKRYSPSLFVVHFGVRGEFPDIPHHSILFGERYGELLNDIYERGVLADDAALYLHHPTASDPSLGPDGCSTFYVLAPVPHMGKLSVDWNEVGPRYADHILARLEARLMPGLRDRIVTSFHYTPKNFAQDLNAHLGSAFSLEPLLTQSAFFRVHNRDDVIGNLYFVGAGTHPGAGIPGVVGSARATADLILADLAVSAA